ncbi:MAG: flagellar motor switch protein FliN [Clostridia bacterium]|nr:flagellar motor switch protein FliN [Clostridia bacterium]
MSLTPADIDKLLEAMNKGQEKPRIKKARFAKLQPAATSTASASYDSLAPIPLQVEVELGRTQLKVRDVINLKEGSLITLNKLAGEPLAVRVNGVLLAYGEVVVINDSFGIKINNLVTADSEERD